MSTSTFAVPAQDSAPILDAILEPTPLDDEQQDKTARLLVIPISQEIAPDFVLVGYGDSIRRIQEVLSQRGLQRNVLLYGGEGVGKTAVIQGIVKRKNENELSTHMYKRMFYRLNTSLLLHTDDLPEINRKFDQVLEEFGRYDVLVIEGFYTFISSLRTRGANGVLIGLIDALSRKRIQVIATCNTREKALIFNEIPEVHEFFFPEQLTPPNNVDLLNILRGVHHSYEEMYGISITDSALRACRDLTQKYRQGLEGWEQPGRAFLVLDRGISQFSVRMNSRPDELCALETEADNLRFEIESLTHNHGNHELYDAHDATRHAACVKRLAEIEPQIHEMADEWQKSTAPIQALQAEKAKFENRRHGYITRRYKLEALRNDTAALTAKGKDSTSVLNEITQLNEMIRIASGEIRKLDDDISKINLSGQRDHVLTDEHIAQTFSELSGIPSSRLTQDERERVLNMPQIIGQRVFGQGEAVEQVCNAVRRARAGLSDGGNGTRGAFLLLGPSGVGKTELGKALAEFDTGSVDNLVRIDMSEFMEKHTVSKLIGAPPGYAGYESGGVLTNAVRKRPNAVVMFDETEKAHEDIFNILLQILGDGRLTDGAGDTVDFHETMVILTSNVGTPYFLDEGLSYEEAKAKALKQMESVFKPEIRGRLDDIMCFHRLGPDILESVAKRRFAQINANLADRSLYLAISDDDTKRIVTAFRDDRYGARAILNKMKGTLEAKLAQAILAQSNGGGAYYATFDQTNFAIRFEPAH